MNLAWRKSVSRSPLVPVSPSDQFRLAAGQLEHCWVSKINFVENEHFTPSEESVRYNVDHSSRSDFNEKADSALLHLDVAIKWTHSDDAGDFTPPFVLDLTVTGLFEWRESMHDPALREAWLEWNGVYLLWPYLRACVAQITTISSLPTLTIYTLRVPDPPPSATEKLSKARASTAKKPARSSGTAASRVAKTTPASPPSAARRSSAAKKRPPAK
jgi:preprotein translocase subunit SecB